MNNDNVIIKPIVGWVIEKKQDGILFEVVEGSDDIPSTVTFRDDAIAPHDSYAWELPYTPKDNS